jgi:hypothetical protein
MRWIAAMVFAISATAVGAVDAQDSPLPRALSKAIKLGESQSRFESELHVSASQCASCYDGEHLAEVTRPSLEMAGVLAQLGLRLQEKSAVVRVFFERGVLTSVYLEGLTGAGALEKIRRRFGPGTVVQQNAEVLEIEWHDAKTRIRITKWEDEYQLILADGNTKGPGRVTKS